MRLSRGRPNNGRADRLRRQEAEADGGSFGGCVKPATQKEQLRDPHFARNQSGRRRVVSAYVSEAAIPSPRFSIRKVRLLHSFASAARKKRFCTPTKRHHGMNCMSVSKSRESTIKRHTASMARALTWLRNTSSVYAAPKSAFTNISPVRISSSARRGRPGARTIAASLTEIR